MSVTPPLLVGFDGSPGAARAAVVARALAPRLGARVSQVRVADRVDPVVELRGLAAAGPALAIVVGRRSRSATRAALRGTVSGRLAAAAPVPVIVVAHGGSGGGAGGGIVCGVDGSAHARRAVAVAARLAARLGVRLTLVAADDVARAGPCSAVLADAARAAGGVAPHVEVALVGVVGEAAQGLAAVAADRGADLVAVGSRGRGPWRVALLGSVSSALMCTAPCPVLIVPPAGAGTGGVPDGGSGVGEGPPPGGPSHGAPGSLRAPANAGGPEPAHRVPGTTWTQPAQAGELNGERHPLRPPARRSSLGTTTSEPRLEGDADAPVHP